eukprot:2288-Heterococcus_DN1.PRE.1
MNPQLPAVRTALIEQPLQWLAQLVMTVSTSTVNGYAFVDEVTDALQSDITVLLASDALAIWTKPTSCSVTSMTAAEQHALAKEQIAGVQRREHNDFKSSAARHSVDTTPEIFYTHQEARYSSDTTTTDTDGTAAGSSGTGEQTAGASSNEATAAGAAAGSSSSSGNGVADMDVVITDDTQFAGGSSSGSVAQEAQQAGAIGAAYQWWQTATVVELGSDIVRLATSRYIFLHNISSFVTRVCAACCVHVLVCIDACIHNSDQDDTRSTQQLAAMILTRTMPELMLHLVLAVVEIWPEAVAPHTTLTTSNNTSSVLTPAILATAICTVMCNRVGMKEVRHWRVTCNDAIVTRLLQLCKLQQPTELHTVDQLLQLIADSLEQAHSMDDSCELCSGSSSSSKHAELTTALSQAVDLLGMSFGEQWTVHPFWDSKGAPAAAAIDSDKCVAVRSLAVQLLGASARAAVRVGVTVDKEKDRVLAKAEADKKATALNAKLTAINTLLDEQQQQQSGDHTAAAVMTVAAGAAQFTAHDVDYSYIHRSVETVLAIDVVDTVNIPLAQLQLMLDNSCKPVAHFINLARRPD